MIDDDDDCSRMNTKQKRIYVHESRSLAPIYIMDGYPQFFYLPSNYNLTLVYSKTTSDPFYVSSASLNSYHNVYMSRAHISKSPSSNSNEWSMTSFGFDSISVGVNDPNFSVNTDYYMTLHGTFNTLLYFSVASVSTYVNLVPNTPIPAYVPGQEYRLFKFCSYKAEHKVVIKTITTTILTNPDIYVIKGDYSDPAVPPSKFNKKDIWSRETTTTTPILIEDNTAGCLYLSLLHYASDATIQIIASDDIMRLADGIAQPAKLLSGQTDTFRFSLTHATKELQFIVHTVCIN